MFSKSFIASFWRKQLTSLVILMLVIPYLSAKESPDYISKIRSFSTEFPIVAVAMSSDEALIAVAMETTDSKAQVVLFDRLTSKPIASILPQGSSVQQLQFDNYTQQLVIVDSDSMELWDLSNIPTHPEKSLSSQFLIAKTPHNMVAGSTVSFRNSPRALRWPESQNLQNWELPPQTQNSAIWTEKQGKPLEKFSFSPDEQWVAYNHEGGKQIFLSNPQQKQTKPPLDYHNFPVTHVEFLDDGRLISLDRERNLIWGDIDQRVKTHSLFLQNIPRQETPVGFAPIFKDQFFAILSTINAPQGFFHIMDKKGESLHSLPLISPQAYAISPTGTYIILASHSHQISMYQFRYHLDPKEYIQTLNDNGAGELARNYRNHLEKALDLPEIPQNIITLQNYLDHLKAAIHAEQWNEVDQWAEKILAQNPRNPDALEAKRLLKDVQDLRIFQQGQEEFEQKQFKQTIRTLIQIPKTSPYRQEARQLIAEAEKQLQDKLTVEKVKREILLENWSKAKALLLPVLSQSPEDPEMSGLLEEIENHETIASIYKFLAYTFLAGILGGLGFLVLRFRHTIQDWLSLKETEPSPLKPPLASRKKKTDSVDDSAQKQYFLETLEKTKKVLALCKAADKHGKHTNRLIDFEAEIAVIGKKATQSNAQYPQLTKQLFHLMQTLRSLNFEKQQKRSQQGRQQQQKKQRPREQRNQEQGRQDQKRQEQAPPETKSTGVDYYAILGVSKTAAATEIKRAYLQKMKDYHPDLHQNSDFDWIKKQAAEKTRLVREAYEVLKEKSSRQQYDQARK